MAKPLINLTLPVERVLLVGAPLKRSAARHQTAEHLEELARLADTAGAEVVGEVTQNLDRPNPATYLGSGKIEELKTRIEELDASLLIFDDELSPSQGKNIEDLTGKRVMDRAELILDIFATRARSSEAKMQVELAQLEYLLPRLTRMWAHLEKFRGGIGVRGPGETQLETDRRLIGHRIKVLKRRLEDAVKSREVRRASRKDEFRVSLVGYTNAGKSSILRALAGDSRVFVEDRLFATLDPLTRAVELGEGETVLMTDTVGFVRKLPHQLVASFRATLEEVLDADVLLHVVDVANPVWEEQRVVVNQVLGELGAQEKPVLYVFTKTDLLPREQTEAMLERISNLAPGSVFVNTAEAGGVEPLRRALLRRAQATQHTVEFRIPVGDGQRLAELYSAGEVLSRRLEGDEMIIRARIRQGDGRIANKPRTSAA